MAAITIDPSAVRHSEYATVVNKVASLDISAGQPVAIVENGAVAPASATAVGVQTEVFGIAVNSAAEGQDIDICTRDPEFQIGGTVAIGMVYIVGASYGSIHPLTDKSTGWKVSPLCVGTSTSMVNLFPVDQCRANVAIP